MGGGIGLLESATVPCIDVDGVGNADAFWWRFAFAAGRGHGRSHAPEPRERIVDFDRRVLLLAGVRIACWFHCLQLVAEQRGPRTRGDLCVRESCSGGVSRLDDRK